jgi:hypothetical protein
MTGRILAYLALVDALFAAYERLKDRLDHWSKEQRRFYLYDIEHVEQLKRIFSWYVGDEVANLLVLNTYDQVFCASIGTIFHDTCPNQPIRQVENKEVKDESCVDDLGRKTLPHALP